LPQGIFTVTGIGEELEAPSIIGDRSVLVSLIGIGIWPDSAREDV
jgi:hypothetical protein